MKIRMKVGVAGPYFDANGSPHYWPGVGEVGDVDEANAIALINAGQAEAVKAEPVVERAVVEPEVEKAVVEPKPAKKAPPAMTTKSLRGEE